MIDAYLIHILILVGIYVILAISLNLSMGYTGLLNIGHIAFYGIGAYTSALLAVHFHLSFFITFLAGALLAGIFGLLVAIPTIKLRGDYLAIATLGFAIVVESVLRNWISLTRGPIGLPGIPKPALFGLTFSGYSYLILVGIFCILTYLIINHIVNSPFGRILKSIREDEIAAASLGKNVLKYKAIALVISAFFAGIAGALYAHYLTFLDPSTFTVLESILIIAMIIIGGLASSKGAVVGAFVIMLIREPLRFLPLPSFAVGALRQMIYAGLLVLILLKKPKGLFGEFSFGGRK